MSATMRPAQPLAVRQSTATGGAEAPSPATPEGGTEPFARRVLVVSADIGGGHDATGRALAERVRTLWPGSRVGWVDTLDVMGPGVGRSFRRTYRTNVAATPWLYEFFWASIWRHRWFATASKWFTGAWAGRRLAPVVEAFDPDLIVSTYPLGSAGLAWLRRRRGLGVPVGAWVCDFAPHPSWVYSELDLDLVVHPAAVPVAAVAAPGVRLGVCAPPVLDRFHPGDRVEAARRSGLDPARSAVVVACGSYGFGHVEEAIDALVGIGDPVQVVAVCGRNERLVERLAALRLPPDRLLVRQWVDDMPTLLRAAGLVVTNAGGATALEAWASGTPIVMYRPIAAHGVANAALMTAAGVAETAHSPNALVACVRSRLVGGQAAGATAPAAHPHLPDLGLPALADARGPVGDTRPASVAGRPGMDRLPPVGRPASWPLRPQDAFFLHVQSERVAQHIGTVLELGPRADGRAVAAADLVALLAARLPAIATLRRRLDNRGRWRRPGWIVDRYVDPAAHVDEVTVAPGDDGGAALDRFWSEPLAADRPLWRILLVSGLPDRRTRVAVKVHHSLGDGMSVIGILGRLLDRPAGRAAGPQRPAPFTPEQATVARPERGERLRRLGLTARGLARLATQGPAPVTGFNRPIGSPERRLVTASLPAAEVLRAARACRAHASELMLALTATALGAVRPAGAPPRLRAMFAVSRNPRRRAPTHGNWTGAVNLDLPLGRCSPQDRVVAVRQSLRTALDSGEAEAAGLVMRTMGALPAPLHAALARRVYTSRHLNVIVSYMALPWDSRLLAGAPLRAAIPVVALAEGVPLGVGVLRCRNAFEIGVLLDESLADIGTAFVAALRTSLTELLDEVEAGDEGGAGPGGGSVERVPEGAPAGRSRSGVPRCA
ncbi:acyltransferase, WS/DGAT/MGAT [Micromonospora viridifaciens]|uniref:Acyltransferase, WS/DGAT/MGAT n=1 Tax=Micromonospora viridifaciens TaxID=1881 RepID=A0A1C4XH88_MICVI|nr:wax ester/triacylglycerol synthase domain-containing protein [Micromonospora viridifaciens]SCF07900.1 acyltransferase, WS/DGAT/MGAT [Micromonospora viridifaciens]